MLGRLVEEGRCVLEHLNRTIDLVVQDHPHGTLTDFRGKLVRRLARHAPTFSEVGASGKPRAVQPGVAASSLEWLWEQGKEAYERKDYAEAVRWYRKAAEQGQAAGAQDLLGAMYADGEGVPQDFVSSYGWLNLAVSRYTADEASLRAATIETRDKVLAHLTPVQIATAQQWALAWRPGLPTTPGTGNPSGKKGIDNGQ